MAVESTVGAESLTARFSDGSTSEVSICIGTPVGKDDDFACPVAIQGLRVWSGETEILGVSSWNSLLLGIQFLQEIFESEAANGTSLYVDSEIMTVKELFLRPASNNNAKTS